MERMNASMERLFMPTFDGDQFLECIKELLRVDKDWIPTGEGNSLYLRPTAISTQPTLGVGQAMDAKLFDMAPFRRRFRFLTHFCLLL